MSSRNLDSGTSGSSSPTPQNTPTHQSVPNQSQSSSSSVSASKQEQMPQQQDPNGENPTDETPTQENTIEETPNQEKPIEKEPFDKNPNQEKPINKAPNQENPTHETETPERESKRIKTGEAVLEQGQSSVAALEEESSDDESSSSDEEYDPNEELILFPEISKGSEEYDDINFMKYILDFEERTKYMPLPISINERPPMSYQMEDLLLYIEEVWGHKNLRKSVLKNKVIKMQNKYRNLLLENGPNPGILDLGTQYGRLHFELLKQTFN